MTAGVEIIRAAYPVPYYAQVASPELAGAIFGQGLDPALDPRWAESGAVSVEEYVYWTDRACGVACVKMCVEALGGPVRPLLEWARAGVKIGGYLTDLRQGGSPYERGWLHSALAELIRGEGVAAQPRPAALEEFPALLAAGSLMIASVSYEIGLPGPVTKRGGHLVVVSGAELQDGRLAALIVHNPSGRTAEMRAYARIPVECFESGYTGRVIVVGPA